MPLIFLHVRSKRTFKKYIYIIDRRFVKNMEKKKKLKGKGWWADGLVGSEWRRFGIVSNLPDSSTAVASSLRRPPIAACLNRRHPTLPL